MSQQHVDAWLQDFNFLNFKTVQVLKSKLDPELTALCRSRCADADIKELIFCLMETKNCSYIRAMLPNSLSLFHLLANAPYLISLSVFFFLIPLPQVKSQLGLIEKKVRVSLPNMCVFNPVQKKGITVIAKGSECLHTALLSSCSLHQNLLSFLFIFCSE